MYSQESRQKIAASCVAGKYGKVFEVESNQLGGSFFHHLSFHLEADANNGGNVTITLQTRANSLADWEDEYVVPTALTPGGFIDVSKVFTKAQARVLISSAYEAKVEGTLLFPGEQGGIAVDTAPLSCGTTCEVTSET